MNGSHNVIVAEYPTPENQQDGMIQRVAAIDALFGDQPRTYLSIQFKGNLTYRCETHGAVTVHYLNYFRHYFQIAVLSRRATTLYIHSAYNFLRLLPLLSLKGKRIFFDAHGVVPEELRLYEGKPVYAAIIGWVERLIIKRAHLVITVTQQMAEHFAQKYSAFSVERCLVLPIFDYAQRARTEGAESRSNLAILYSGGVQGWQNIDLMMTTLKRLAERRIAGLKMSFFVPRTALEVLEQRLAAASIDSEALSVSVGSLPKGELLQTYLRYSLGFVLRNDDPVNRAACPTKLMEYLENGVVPIVLSPNIGDFAAQGIRYLTLDQLATFTFDPQELEAMREANWAVIRRMRLDAEKNAHALAAQLNPGTC
jgi:hypothetical protein